MTMRGMYGAPRKLCTDTVRQLCRVAELLQPMNPIRLIAISTEGARPGFTQLHIAPTACTACTACTAYTTCAACTACTACTASTALHCLHRRAGKGQSQAAFSWR